MHNPNVLEREFAQYDINMAKWYSPKPFGFSGCFRVRNDEEFLASSVISHLPYLDEAIILVQTSEDRSVEIARNLMHEYPHKVKTYLYEPIVYWIDDPRFIQTPENSVYSICHMSNYALSLCNYSWIVKVEADVICLSSFKEKVIDRILEKPDIPMYYGMTILNVAGEKMDMISRTAPRNWCRDEAVFPSHPDYFFVKFRDRWESVNFFDHPSQEVSVGWTHLHMKRCKTRNAHNPNNEVWYSFTPEGVTSALAEYNADYGYCGQDNPLGIPELFEKTYVKKYYNE